MDDDDLIYCLVHGTVPNHGPLPESLSHLVREGAERELERRFWDKCWDHCDKQYRKSARVSAEHKIDIEKFVNSRFQWLVNEGAVAYLQYKAQPKREERTFSSWFHKCNWNALVDCIVRKPEYVHEVPPTSPDPGDDRDVIENTPDANVREPFARSKEEEEIDRLSRRITELQRASQFRSDLQECLTILRQRFPDQHLAVILHHACNITDRAEIATLISNSDRPVTEDSVNTWIYRGEQHLIKLIEEKGYRFVRGPNRIAKERLGGVVVMTLSDSVLLKLAGASGGGDS